MEPSRFAVAQLPEQMLVFTNAAYLNTLEFQRFFHSSSSPASPLSSSYIICRNYLIQCLHDPRIVAGTIGLSKIQRDYLGIDARNAASGVEFIPYHPQYKVKEAVLSVRALQDMKTATVLVDTAELSEVVVNPGLAYQVGTQFIYELHGERLLLTVTSLTVEPLSPGAAPEEPMRGVFCDMPALDFEKEGKRVQLRGSNRQAILKKLDLRRLGIGGLEEEFEIILRRAFISRLFSQDTVRKLGISHIRGMLLYGPPGTGKTLIAREIGKLLNAREPKRITGPELLNKYVGESEANVRNLFAEAEAEQQAQGDRSELHIIIIDELDAVCKTRGSRAGDSGVGDSLVNQLLAKLDGVDQLDNILLIGMTNRKDLIDEALLRPGRLEVQLEIGLPDEAGRVQIFNIHTSQLRERNAMDTDVSVEDLARRTKNFTGAEIAGVVRSARSFALRRCVNLDAPDGKQIDEQGIRVTHSDFVRALEEAHPIMGVRHDMLREMRGNEELVPYSSHFERAVRNLRLSLQMRDANLRIMLLEGPRWCGRTAVAAEIAQTCGIPFVQFLSCAYISSKAITETGKADAIRKVFEDAYKSPLSLIIVDDFLNHIGYNRVGPVYSKIILQELRGLFAQPPPAGRKLAVLVTTSQSDVIDDFDIRRDFHQTLSLHPLERTEVKRLLFTLLHPGAPVPPEEALAANPELEALVQPVHEPVPIKQLLSVWRRAQLLSDGGVVTAEAFAEAFYQFS